jgi:hypothetical protein
MVVLVETDFKPLHYWFDIQHCLLPCSHQSVWLPRQDLVYIDYHPTLTNTLIRFHFGEIVTLSISWQNFDGQLWSTHRQPAKCLLVSQTSKDNSDKGYNFTYNCVQVTDGKLFSG